jgi:hypothetical protein
MGTLRFAHPTDWLWMAGLMIDARWSKGATRG